MLNQHQGKWAAITGTGTVVRIRAGIGARRPWSTVGCATQMSCGLKTPTSW